MTKKLLLILAAVPLLNACDTAESASRVQCPENQKEFLGKCYNKNDCVPGCDTETQKCILGTCYDKEECVPECDSERQKCYKGRCVGIYRCTPDCDEETEKCFQGECIDIDTCMPECDSETEKCAAGSCIDKNQCYPPCQGTDICSEGTCKPMAADPTACEGRLCKDEMTYCDDTGHWNTCEPGSGCLGGSCLQGIEPECDDQTCSDDKTQECQGGTWVECGSLEVCNQGHCKITEAPCEPGTCNSDDSGYYCDSEGHYKACEPGFTCNEGHCENAVDLTKAMLWQTCRANSDCPRGICLFEVSPSRAMSKGELGIAEINKIPVSMIDRRIPEGSGICSQDCTRDSSICDTISSDKQSFKCQLVIIGDSPYPPKDAFGNTLSLPFHKSLDLNKMVAAPYASLCRPNDPSETTYSRYFCKSCRNTSECGASESCVYGACLPKCSSTLMCPLNFTCATPDGMQDSFCLPNTNTCGDCLDGDNDGQGFGACSKPGFDCDDTRNDIYYGKPLAASSCTRNATDDNCNGKLDYTELIGTADNCTACGETCKVGDAANITRVCNVDNGGKPFDDSTYTTIENTYQFACEDTCDTGYADCDGDVSNGCETQLVTISSDGIVSATENAVTFSLDADQDGHGVKSAQSTHYCCKTNENICFGMPNTDTNLLNYWATITPDSNVLYSTDIDDCDDSNPLRFPGNPDVCDGLDNDCNAETPDGIADYVKLDNYVYKPANSEETGKYSLGDTCTLYEPTSHNSCTDNGIIQCKPSGSNYSMICFNPEATDKDDDCDGYDDNCNGQIDEDYVFVSCKTDKKGICNFGVQTCENGHTVCKELFTARPIDFYGDETDSSCDGYDFDYNNAMFIELYSAYGTTSGNDNHTGRPDNPVATLNYALKQAHKKIDDTSYFVHDIFVSKNVKDTPPEDGDAKWGKEKVIIPPQKQAFTATLKGALEVPGSELTSSSSEDDIIDAHVKAYQNKIKGDPAYADYNPNDYLYPGEVWPRKEFVRIYGGFDSSAGWTAPEGETDVSEYNYTINALSVDINDDNSLPENVYEMITCGDYNQDDEYVPGLFPTCVGELSLKLDHINFNMSADMSVYAKQSGTTFVGLNCGNYSNGCEELVMVYSNINVEGAAGLLGVTPTTDNNNWPDKRNGVDSTWHVANNASNPEHGGMSVYFPLYMRNMCSSVLREEGTGGVTKPMYDYWSNEKIGQLNFACPDRISPLGGCGGTYCGRSDCPSVINMPAGMDGYGVPPETTADENNRKPGSGAPIARNSVTSKGCGTMNEKDTSSKPKGYKGTPGIGGQGGQNTDLTLKLQAQNLRTIRNESKVQYVATYSGDIADSTEAANGHYGTSGSGGGGGGVLNSYDCDHTIVGQYLVDHSYWIFGGIGGAGGCGGYGGGAGGTGGSAIGIEVRPPISKPSQPADQQKKFTLSMTKSTINAQGAQGGQGAQGQSGMAGGTGGKGLKYGKEEGKIDTHCHHSTAGGAGGAGGGGGGGAGGLSGQAYGILFICPISDSILPEFAELEDLDDCNIIVPSEFIRTPTTYATAKTESNGTTGATGVDGAWSACSNDAECNSTAGSPGMGGTVGTTTSGNTTALPVGFSNLRN